MKTASEHLFEKYLSEQGYSGWEYEPPFKNKNKRIDFRLPLDTSSVFLDVKEFDPRPPQSGYYDPLKPLRKKVQEAKEQFKEYREFSCSLILANPRSAFVHFDEWAIYGAMFGDIGFQIPVGPGVSANEPIKPVFLGGGKMVYRGKPWNTTISSIVVLGRYPAEAKLKDIKIRARQRELGRNLNFDEMFELRYAGSTGEIADPLRVVVHENPFARNPMSRKLFCGRFDERWGADGDYVRRIYVGGGVRDFERPSSELSSIPRNNQR